MAIQIQNDLERRLKDKDFAEEYGENIAKAEIAVTVSQARRSRNLTQEDLAKMLGASQAYIAKLEGGDANPTIGNIGKILANIGLRLVAGVSALSSRIEEKGVLNYSSSANNVAITLIGEVVSASVVVGHGFAMPSNVISIDERGFYGYGAVVSNPTASSVSGYGEYYDTIWEASQEGGSRKLIKGAK